MEITLKVELDCTPRLEKVLTAIGDALTGLNEIKETKPATPRKKAKEEVKVETEKEPQMKVENIETTAMVEQPAEEAKPAPKVEEEEKKETTEITDVDLRGVVKACRMRIMGGEENGDPILRAAITQEIKAKLVELGAEKIGDLPQSLRPEFVKFCENLDMVNNEGKPAPF